MIHVKIEPTFTVGINMAGDMATAKAWLRRYCTEVGLCVTVTPTEFIYTGGYEEGFVVGLVNYPRFPSSPLKLMETAEHIAMRLMEECGQHSSLLIAPDFSKWMTRRVQNASPIEGK